jgi:hypothetical protein
MTPNPFVENVIRGTGVSRHGDPGMDRRCFLATFAVGAMAAPSGVGADERLRRVGWLELGLGRPKSAIGW